MSQAPKKDSRRKSQQSNTAGVMSHRNTAVALQRVRSEHTPRRDQEPADQSSTVGAVKSSPLFRWYMWRLFKTLVRVARGEL